MSNRRAVPRCEVLPLRGSTAARAASVESDEHRRGRPKVRIAPLRGSAAARAASVKSDEHRRAVPRCELLLRGQRSGASRKRGGPMSRAESELAVLFADVAGSTRLYESWATRKRC